MSKRKKEKVFGVVCAATADNIYYFPVIFSAKIQRSLIFYQRDFLDI